MAAGRLQRLEFAIGTIKYSYERKTPAGSCIL